MNTMTLRMRVGSTGSRWDGGGDAPSGSEGQPWMKLEPSPWIVSSPEMYDGDDDDDLDEEEGFGEDEGDEGDEDFDEEEDEGFLDDDEAELEEGEDLDEEEADEDDDF